MPDSDAVHLAGADADDLFIFCKDDRIALDVLGGYPCELQILKLLGRRLIFGRIGESLRLPCDKVALLQ